MTSMLTCMLLQGMYPTVLVVAISWQTLQTSEAVRSIHHLTQVPNPQVPKHPAPSTHNLQGETEILVRDVDSIVPAIELCGVGEAEDLEASLKHFLNEDPVAKQ